MNIPLIGFGTYKLTTQEIMDTAVSAAIEAGYRLFDTASAYCNEDLLGNTLKSLGCLDSCYRRNIFITSKVWNDAQRENRVRESFMRSMENLQTDYVDLFLIHWPVPGCYERTWKDLELIKSEGLARSIGVSNFTPGMMENLKSVSGEVPALNQVEYHPLFSSPRLKSYCRQNSITLQAYAPLARGAYTDIPILNDIGHRYGKNSSQVGLRWLIQQEISIIPKSSNPDRIRENIAITDFTLTDEEMNAISALNRNFQASHPPADMR